jgi:hypothetical protein
VNTGKHLFFVVVVFSSVTLEAFCYCPHHKFSDALPCMDGCFDPVCKLSKADRCPLCISMKMTNNIKIITDMRVRREITQ